MTCQAGRLPDEKSRNKSVSEQIAKTKTHKKKQSNLDMVIYQEVEVSEGKKTKIPTLVLRHGIHYPFFVFCFL